MSGSTDDLPPPDAPPDTEHTQLFFPYFTHREEPPVALVALGLWNDTAPSPFKMDHKRKWKTSHVLPFLGHGALYFMSLPAVHRLLRSPWSVARKRRTDFPSSHNPVALERLACPKEQEDYIRVVVNGASQKLDSCHSGPGGSCPLGDFKQFVDERVERYGDFEGACKKEEEQ